MRLFLRLFVVIGCFMPAFAQDATVQLFKIDPDGESSLGSEI